MIRPKNTTFAFAAILALTACQSNVPPPKGVKVGKPYNVAGKMYYPSYDPTYDETGIASWYGPGFHGNRTANGEKFNTHDLTAAHPTLPLPSLVRVTNIDNGKTLVVRINDRGPFAEGRIIDLSKAAAKKLGVTGLANVRVQYLTEESEQYIASIAEGKRVDMFAFNNEVESDQKSTILAATAPADENMIVESTQNQTQPGEMVTAAAPILSVRGKDLPKKQGGGVLIRQAYAEEPIGGEVVLTKPVEEPFQVASLQPATPVFEPIKAEDTITNSKPSPTGSYFVQVGSFSQQDNAQSMQNQISDIANSTVAMVEVGGHSWWRLRAGPFVTSDDANSALEKIRNLGAADARIMRH